MTVDRDRLPRHVAIIMDGNGRWAVRRGLPRVAGHRYGVEAVRRVSRAARDMGIEYLTLYSFSSENWSRPKSEVSELFSLMRLFIRRDLAELHQNNVRLRVIGQREGVPDDVMQLLVDAEKLTADNCGQNLVIAFNYGSRNEIAQAAAKLARMAAQGALDPDTITPELFENALETHGIPDPDLIIRTSGELRLSNFLLWQAAYSELLFTDTLWPDFGPEEFAEAVRCFSSRDRRFGGIASRGARETAS